MIAIGLKFPSGRFHATPWNRHVNEGVPEWPPSPWRLLRSLVFSWKIKSAQLKEDQVRCILETLISPPTYHLPSATTGHSRHYMRWYKKGPEDQTLVFDAFVCIDRESEVIVQWPYAELDDEQSQVLTKLLEGLGYLGRAESWCEARLLDEQEAQNVQSEYISQPLNGDSPSENQELVRVLCPHPTEAFDDTHVIQTKVKGRGKNKEIIKESLYDPAWHLCIETAQLHKEKWSDPPGSQWVTYVRPSDCFMVKTSNRLKSTPELKQPSGFQVARYALDSTVLPLSQEALPIAEEVRRKLINHSTNIAGRKQYRKKWDWDKHRAGEQPVDLSPFSNLTGKDEDVQPLQGHGHAYYLPTDEDGDGRLDHLTIVTQNGFTRGELQALDKLNILNYGDENHKLRVLLLGLGKLNTDDFTPLPIQQSQVWVSATPFIVTRHLKKKGQKRDPQELHADHALFVKQVLKEEINRFLARQDLLDEIDIEQVEINLACDENRVFRIDPSEWYPNAQGAPLRPIQFKRNRRRKRNDDGDQRKSGCFKIIFPGEVSGPIALGHSAHFGMGLFLPSK